MTRFNRRQFVQLGLAGAAAGALAAPALTSVRAAEKTRITFMGLFWLKSEIEAAARLVQQFNEQSATVEVQYIQGSWSTVESKMTVAFSSGDAPDVFHYYDAGLVPWGQNGLLADLKTLLPEALIGDVNAGVLSSVTSPQYGLLGMPFETETPLIYFNVDKFEQAGIAPATMDGRWTWERMREVAHQLTDPASGVFGITAQWAASEVLFKSGLGWQAGAEPITEDSGQYTIGATDAGTRSAVEYLRSLFEDGSADPTGFDGDISASFQSGKSAMMIRGAWSRTLLPANPTGSDVRWSAMPFLQGKVPNLGSGAAQTLSIPRSSKKQEAAAEFIAWWSRPENVAVVCESSGQVPPSIAAVDVLRKSVGDSNFWGETLATVKELNGQPYCPGWLPMLGKTWNPAMFNYLKGKSSFDAFAEQVATAGTVDVQTAAGNL